MGENVDPGAQPFLSEPFLSVLSQRWPEGGGKPIAAAVSREGHPGGSPLARACRQSGPSHRPQEKPASDRHTHKQPGPRRAGAAGVFEAPFLVPKESGSAGAVREVPHSAGLHRARLGSAAAAAQAHGEGRPCPGPPDGGHRPGRRKGAGLGRVGLTGSAVRRPREQDSTSRLVGPSHPRREADWLHTAAQVPRAVVDSSQLSKGHGGTSILDKQPQGPGAVRGEGRC